MVAMAAMVLIKLSSDRHGERILHVAGSALLGALGLFAAGLAASPVLLILSFCLASIGIYAALAVFWTLPTAILRGLAAAGPGALEIFFQPSAASDLPDGLGQTADRHLCIRP